MVGTRLLQNLIKNAPGLDVWGQQAQRQFAGLFPCNLIPLRQVTSRIHEEHVLLFVQWYRTQTADWLVVDIGHANINFQILELRKYVDRSCRQYGEMDLRKALVKRYRQARRER